MRIHQATDGMSKNAKHFANAGSSRAEAAMLFWLPQRAKPFVKNKAAMVCEAKNHDRLVFHIAEKEGFEPSRRSPDLHP